MKRNLIQRRGLLLSFFAVCLFIYNSSIAQDCINTGINGKTFQLQCPQSCSTLVLQIPHIKGSTQYSVSGISYTPYPYVAGGGIELDELYADDVYSSVINLPFPFCFYGSQYSSCVAGSNGLISFDISNAGLVNSWSLTTIPNGTIPQPIPYSGGLPNTVSNTYYPRAAVMGAYHDIFPLISGGGQRRIEYSVTGITPCRKFIVSYYRVPMYGSAACNSTFCSQQIVLHESTGIIDVFIGDKPVCSVWNEGLAILGLQNWNRDAAVAAPGKNCSMWSEADTAYRFTPSGPGSRFVKAELYNMSGILISSADTLTSVQGLLDLRFLNLCPPDGANQYEVRTTFSSCSAPATQWVTSDTITVTKDNSLNAVSVSTNSACGPPSGTITITVPPGTGTAPFTYLLDGGPPVISGNSHTFTAVAHGSHTVQVQDAPAVCSSLLSVTVGRDNALLADTTTTSTYCAGSASGTITVTVSNGTGPFTYTLNGAMLVTAGSPYTYTGLSAGSYLLQVTDATGCMNNPVPVAVFDGPGVLADTTTVAATCSAVSNGSITLTVTSGQPPFIFQLDGGTPVSGLNTFTFTSVPAGPHTVTISDAVNCTRQLPITVSAGPDVNSTNTIFPPSCNGAHDAIIKVEPVYGMPPYSFSLDAMPPVAGPQPYYFNNLNPGPHTIQVFDASGCSSSIMAVNIPFGPDLTTTAETTNVMCAGGNTGVISIHPPAMGAAPFQYSLDGINWQLSTVFSGLSSGTYTVYLRSANNCNGFLQITLQEPSMLTATLTTTAVTCFGLSDGKINIMPQGGVPPYEYSIDAGINWQTDNSFSVAAGIYQVIIQDANGCSDTLNAEITSPDILTAGSVNTDATCDGGDNGQIQVSATGGSGQYLYSLDGFNYQANPSFFTGSGNYTVHVKDASGCSTSFQTFVGLQFNLFLNPLADTSICEGNSVQFIPVSNASLYQWWPAASLNNPGIRNPVASPVDTTVYHLKAVLGVCTLMDTVQVNVRKAPLPDAGADAMICYGDSVQLEGNGGIHYEWLPAAFLNSDRIPQPISTPSRTITYSLFVTDAEGCRSLLSDEVAIYVRKDMAIHTIPFDTIVASGERIRLRANSNGVQYNWTPATGLSNPFIADPVAIVSASAGQVIQYKVSAIDSNGCKGEGFVTIRVYKGPAIYVPSAFTPNQDGRNDLFSPHPVGISGYSYFRVYNRWGQLVFSTTKLNEGWDGKLNSADQPAGVYVWMIEGITGNNSRITQKGTVMLIR